MQPTIKQQIESLRTEIQQHNHRYYTQAAPTISDQSYDELLEKLAQFENDHPQYHSPTSPTQRVGGQPIRGFTTVGHALPMLSIANTYDQQEIIAWDQRITKALDITPDRDAELFSQKIQYLVEPKIDGVAVSLRYEKGILVQALTRGDGLQGDDVTQNARTIRQIKLQLNTANPPAVLEVRGEIYMPDDVFEKINQQRQKQEQDPLANPRNATAGTLKLLDSKIVAKRKLAFWAHGIGQVQGQNFQTQRQFLKAIEAWGLPVNPHIHVVEEIAAIWDFIQRFDQMRQQLGYATDGVVIKVNDLQDQQKLGQTSKSPRWCIAYKFPAQRVTTKLENITWQVGKGGTITPVAELQAVQLAGTTVRRASLHNMDEIMAKDIRVGDMVYVEKAGEIIPQVIGVDLKKRVQKLPPTQPLVNCPSCNQPLIREQDQVALRCINPNCQAQLRERLIWFAARDQMDIDGLGEKAIALFIKKGLLQSIGDIYKLHHKRAQLMTLPRMGGKKIGNLLAAIEKSKSNGLAKLLSALGIRHVGTNAARTLAQAIGSLDQVIQTSIEALTQIPDIGQITAQSIKAFTQSQSGKQIIQDLYDAGLNMQAVRSPSSQASHPANPFAQKTIAITGTFQKIPRKKITQILQDHGAKVSSSISKNTAILVAGEKAGSKLSKAKDLNVPIWDEAKLLKSLQELNIPESF